MADVFVSYKAEDRRRVKPLVEALQADGFAVWWDEQIGGGAAWRHAIEAELNAAKCVIVVWSNRSVGPEGTFVQDEATRAQQRHVYVPLLIDKVHLPLGFGEMQALPLTGWHGDRSDARYQAVLAAVRRNAGTRSSGKARSRSVAHAPAQVDRRAVLAGGAVAAMAVAGVGGWALLKPSAASASGSIAVLPFANLSGDPGQAYFSDGVAEEIRSALARLGGLTVIGRTSSEAVRNEDAPSAAKKLGVANILTGSVRQSPSTIRIGAELVDGRTGADRWSQDYDRPPGDAIKIQVDIAENVASALSSALGMAARAAISLGGTANATAHDLYLKARAQRATDDSESSTHAVIGWLDSAIALDPKFGGAYAEKAQAMNDLAGYFLAKGSRFEPAFAQATVVARQAIALAPNLSAGHMALASILLGQLDISAAAVEFERGHALAGGDVDQLLAYVRFLYLIGKEGQAIALASQAEVRDPLNPVAYSREARALFNVKRFADSVIAFQKALALGPSRIVDRALMSAALMELGKDNEASAELRKLPPENLFRLVGEAVVFARQGNRGLSDTALQHAQQLYGDTANYQYADVYAQRGEKDRAFAALDRAWAFRDPGLAGVKTDFWLAPLRTDPRFQTMVRRIGLPA
jgi:TolB-like protein/tetratricopeptide (TPR) repeat protein